jgi:hypothetical protein
MAVLAASVPATAFNGSCAQPGVSGIVAYSADPNPQDIQPTTHNWEIRLDASDSTNGLYEIVQTDRRLDPGAESRSTTNVLIGLSPMSQKPLIVPNGSGVIDFKLCIGNKKPELNMNAPGNMGQPIVFSGIGTGKAASDWVVLPGSKVTKVTPSDKGTKLLNGKLSIVQFLATNDSGAKFQIEVLLQRK